MSESEREPLPQGVPRILVGADGSPTSLRAVAWAAIEAGLHQCELHILTAVGVPSGFGPGAVLGDAERRAMRRDGEHITSEAAHVARTAGTDRPPVSVTTEVTEELPPHALLTRSAQARMLVVGSRGMGAFSRGLLGSVSTTVARHTHCPVVVVRSPAVLDAVTVRQPVLVGVDGTDNSAPAVAAAFDEASRRETGLIALHAWSDTSGLEVPVRGWDAARAEAEAVLAESLAGYAEQFPDVEVERIITADRPVRSLLDASAGTQLVVVGSHGRGGFTGMLLGSTSNALLHALDTPLLIVRSRTDG
ncbi:universal stress protein [Nocardia carnea]|uniref:Universal stress protein n=1 Tax=Nocardia carnea TaxID=37328 RepID=A0ABW7TLG5_9NOCA|nr:universal stress protein [Nocardia carnea]